MPKKPAEHLYEYFNNKPLNGKKFIIHAVSNAIDEHKGYNVYNLFNGKVGKQANTAYKSIQELSLISEKSINVYTLIDCIIKICNQGKDNNPGVISNWNVSTGSLSSYSSFNTIIVRNMLKYTNYHKNLETIKSNASDYIINTQLDNLAEKTFHDLKALYEENNNKGISFEKNTIFIKNKKNAKNPKKIMIQNTKMEYESKNEY